MKIKKLNATFGNLNNAKLELEDGLNIVEAPNESGKSTWCAFIRAMLYGINTSERDRADHLSAKNRYMPWSGSQMAGTMEVVHEGRRIELQRTAQNGAPMKKLTAVYAETGEEVPEMYTGTAGEMLTGVPENVFERTAFIRQNGMRLNQTAELEKRMSSIVSSGDEHTSYTETNERLKKWLRRRRYNKSGLIPKMEAELQKTNDAIKSLEELNRKLALLRADEEKYKKQAQRYEQDLEAHKYLREWQEKSRILGTEDKLEQKKKELGRLKEKMTVDGRRITRDDVTEVRAAYAAFTSRREDVGKTDSDRGDEAKKYEEACLKRDSSPLHGRTIEEIQLDAADIKAGEQDVETAEKARGRGYILPVIMMVIGVIGAVLCAGPVLIFSIPGLGASTVVFLAGEVLAIVNSTRGRKTAHKVEKRLKELGFASSEELIKKAEEYKSLCDEAERLKTAMAVAEKTYEMAEKTADEAERSVIECARRIDPTVVQLVDVLGAAQRAEKLLDDISDTEIEIQKLLSIYNTLTEKYNGEKIKLPPELPRKPVRDEAETRAELKKAKAMLSSVTDEINLTLGEIRAKGDPAILGGRKKQLEEQIAKNTDEYDAIEFAIKILSEANSEMQAKFSPRISHDACEILREMTGGRYERLLFDKDFDAKAKTVGDPVSHGVLSMSGGTADQIYLSLRLAMCGIMLGGDDPCPIILDDAFVNFDEDRLGRALELIERISHERQVIIFTCQDRERRYFAGRGVNIVTV